MIRTSNPMPEVRRVTVSPAPKMAGSPTTHSVPMTAPATEARPPMTAMDTTDSDMSGGKRSARALVTRPMRSAPANPASPPATANAASFVARGLIV